jgi:hypothetical protein
MFGSVPAMSFRDIWRESRIGPLSVPGYNLSRVELATLVAGGVLATVAVAFLPLQLRIPGHAILKATLPIVLGIALVPRNYAGTLSGLAACGTVGVLLAMGMGNLQMAAVTSLLAIGPAIDLAMHGARRGGWRLYLRFGLAGLIANLLAFAVRWGTAWLGLDGMSPHTRNSLGLAAFLSFACCGLVAGMISAFACFRGSPNSN